MEACRSGSQALPVGTPLSPSPPPEPENGPPLRASEYPLRPEPGATVGSHLPIPFARATAAASALRAHAKHRLRLAGGFPLSVVLALAFMMASIPHLGYGYPLHIDEWWHYGDSSSLLAARDVSFPNVFDSGTPIGTDKELGFHLVLAALKVATGASWLTLFRWVPGIIIALTALAAYFFGKRHGFGLGAAFLVALIPTTIRFLGPAFLVPVALGLVFIPLTLIILHRLMTDARGPLALFLVFLCLLFLHPPTLLAVSVIAVVHFAAFSLPGRGRVAAQARQAALALALLTVVCVLMILWAPSLVKSVVDEAVDPSAHLALPPIGGALAKFGYVPTALFVLGTAILVHRRDRCNMALVTSAILLLAYQVLYPRLHLGPDLLYERGWLYIYVLMALIGGVALRELWRSAREKLRTSAKARMVGTASVSLLVIAAFAAGLHGHLSEQYYHLLDEATYCDFVWIRENVPEEHRVAVTDTALAWAFAPLTGKHVYAAEVSPNFYPEGRATMEFLEEGASDTSWLRERGVTIVYTKGDVNNDELTEIHDNVYLLVD